MSQRDSGYERKERDLYETPSWVTKALSPHLPNSGLVWEPAAGGGKMVEELRRLGYDVIGSDISSGMDFLTSDHPPPPFKHIVTNPPYELATEFILRALQLMPPYGRIAMLLRTDFDHAKTRQNLFGNCRQFTKKVVLTKRIRWFEDSKGSPSFNHAWFIWDDLGQGYPTLAYGP